MQTYPINNTNFTGLYKVPATSISKKVEKLIAENHFNVIRGKNTVPKFYYILTPDDPKIEKKFEEAILEGFGNFWKSEAIKNLLNKDICDTFFRMTKSINKKENWKGKATPPNFDTNL